MTPAQSRRSASRWALTFLTGILAVGSTLGFSQGGCARLRLDGRIEEQACFLCYQARSFGSALAKLLLHLWWQLASVICLSGVAPWKAKGDLGSNITCDLVISSVRFCLFCVCDAEVNPVSGQEQVCTSLLDVFLLVDESGSIGTANYKKVRAFLSDFIQSLPVSADDVHIGLVTYSTKTVTHWTLDDPKAMSAELAAAAAQNLPYVGGVTYTHLGLDLVKSYFFDKSKGARADAPKLLVVLTDGISNNPTMTASSAQSLRNKGVIVVVLGVGSGVYPSECRGMAGCGTSGECPRFLQTDWSLVNEQVASIILAACRDLAKDAVCSDWSEFSPCEGECGTQGTRTRTRVEIQPQLPGTPPCSTCPAPQGRSCEEQPPGLVMVESCPMPECKVDAVCGEFQPWSAWSGTCGTVTRRRERDPYDNPPASGGGLSCTEQSPPKFRVETETEQRRPCPVQQQPGPWNEWSECSASCGGGQRHREREGYPQEGELYGGQSLEMQGIAVRETQTCNESPCPVNATCGDWTEYGPCSRSCGGGIQERRREPWLNNAEHGGQTCLEQHPEGPVSSRECNTQPCPVDEVPGDWGPWGPCDPQCGPGTQSRYRQKSKQDAMYGGKNIAEQNASLPEDEKILLVESRECMNNPCGPCTLPFTEWTECRSCEDVRTRQTMVLFDYSDGKCEAPTNQVESSGGGAGSGAEGGGSEGAGGDAGGAGEEGKDESSSFPTAAVAGGVAGGILLLAAGAGAVYSGVAGGAAASAAGAGVENVAEAGTGVGVEEEKEALISAGEQSDMWAA
ncbi:hypothetical protein Efla_005598 [Eimeria flavescens]